MSGEWETLDILNWEDWDDQNWDNQIDDSVSFSGRLNFNLAPGVTMFRSQAYQVTQTLGIVVSSNQDYIAEQDYEATDNRGFDGWEFVTYNFELDQ